VLDIYDHFSRRRMVQSEGRAQGETTLSIVPDEGQSRYVDSQGESRSRG